MTTPSEAVEIYCVKCKARGVHLSPRFPYQEVPTMTTPSEAVEIYCVKCKGTGSKDIEAVTVKNGRPATRSVCVDANSMPHSCSSARAAVTSSSVVVAAH